MILFGLVALQIFKCFFFCISFLFCSTCFIVSKMLLKNLNRTLVAMLAHTHTHTHRVGLARVFVSFCVMLVLLCFYENL